MYVPPVHAVMIFHNVETNEEIWDYKATDADLKRVVSDNIVGVAGIEAKKAAAVEREKEWEELLRNRCVIVLLRVCLAGVAIADLRLGKIKVSVSAQMLCSRWVKQPFEGRCGWAAVSLDVVRVSREALPVYTPVYHLNVWVLFFVPSTSLGIISHT